MNERDLREALYSKLETEYNDFIKELLLLPSEKMLERSYEKVLKEETLSFFSPYGNEFSKRQVSALYKIDKPLAYLYKEWMRSELSINDVYRESVEISVDNLIDKERSKNKIKDCR